MCGSLEFGLSFAFGDTAGQSAFQASDPIALAYRICTGIAASRSDKLHSGQATSRMQTLSLLKGYQWLGNIRELQNVVERAVILSESDT